MAFGSLDEKSAVIQIRWWYWYICKILTLFHVLTKNGSVINLQSFTLVTNSEVVGVDSENLTTLVQNIIRLFGLAILRCDDVYSFGVVLAETITEEKTYNIPNYISE